MKTSKTISLSLALAFAACGKSTSGNDGGTDAGLQIIDAGRYQLAILPAAASSASCNVNAEQPSVFTDTSYQFGITDGGISPNQLAFTTTDLDGDGYPDLLFYVGHGGGLPPREIIPSIWDGGEHNLPDGGLLQYAGLWLNRPNPNGGRMFVDATESSGLFQVRGGSTTEFRQMSGVAIGDLNNDGTPDVVSLVNSDSAIDGGVVGGTFLDVNEVAMNDGTGHFTLAPQSDPSTTMQLSNESGTLTDIDNDGKLDLLLSYWYPIYGNGIFGSQPQLFSGKGDGTFTDITDSSGSNGGQGLVCDTTGSLASLTGGTGPRPSFDVTACDLNQDGYADLIIGSYGGESNQVFQNDGTGHFFQVFNDGGIDADQDFDYHTDQYYVCYCTLHSSSQYCAGAGPPLIECPSPADAYWQVGVDDNPALLGGNNFSIACRDMNGDGFPDVYVTDIRHWWAGEQTDPSTLILNVTPDAGGPIGMLRLPNSATNIVYPHLDPEGWNEGVQHVALADFDNDGRPDVLSGVSDYGYNYGTFFIQQSDGTYQDKGADWGFHFPCAGGLSVADLDRDGDLDIVATGSLWRNCAEPGGGGWAAVSNPADGGLLDPGFVGYNAYEIHVFSNNASAHSKWLEVRLRGDGTTTNTMGLGARVTVTVNGIPQMQEMTSNYGLGFSGNDIGVLFFGLGDCDSVDSIDVRWPNKALSVDHYASVPAGHLLELHQGDPTVYGVILQ